MAFRTTHRSPGYDSAGSERIRSLLGAPSGPHMEFSLALSFCSPQCRETMVLQYWKVSFRRYLLQFAVQHTAAFCTGRTGRYFYLLQLDNRFCRVAHPLQRGLARRAVKLHIQHAQSP